MIFCPFPVLLLPIRDVYKRQDDDAGTVLVTLHAEAGAVYGGLGELRVVCDGLVPVFNVVGPAFIALAIVFGRTVALVVGDVYKRQALYHVRVQPLHGQRSRRFGGLLPVHSEP